MPGFYHQILNRRQILFVIAWFAIFLTISYLIPSSWKSIQTVSLAGWWIVLVFGVRQLSPTSKGPAPVPKPPVKSKPISALNLELYNKALEHNRESLRYLLWIWFFGVLVVLAGILIRNHFYKISSILITIGLFFASLLSKRFFPNKRDPGA
jgi:hypothetical protein